MFVPKSKLAPLYTDVRSEVEHCLMLLHHCDIFLCANDLAAAKKLTETSSVSGGVFLVKSFEHLFGMNRVRAVAG